MNNQKHLDKIVEINQQELLQLFTEKLSYYTRNESSSVRVEVAEQIMLSIKYTIDLYLKSGLPKEENLKKLFSKAEELVKQRVKEAEELLRLVKQSKLITENYAYNDTIDSGLQIFFDEYDIRYASHDSPGSVDYQLGFDEMRLQGVEYMYDYLNKLCMENRFCSYFDNREIEALLKGYDKGYADLLINIFQLVLINYLGKLILGKNDGKLDISDQDRQRLRDLLIGLSYEEVKIKFLNAVQALCYQLSINEKEFVDYITITANKAIPDIIWGIQNDKLEYKFISLNWNIEKFIDYKDGESLEDSIFKSVTEEIRDCINVEDKIKIVREEIHSLKDLKDVLAADCIFEDEFIKVYQSLNDFEIALLMKSIFNYQFDEYDKEWKVEFKRYFSTLEQSKKGELIKLSEQIRL